MDGESFDVPGLCTLRRQVTRLPGSSGGENVFVSWEGRVRLPGGERAELFVGDDDVRADEEVRRALVQGLTRFFGGGEAQLRHEVAADLLGLVNHARAAREVPAPPLTLETLLPRVTLEDVAWDDGEPSATYRLDEPEFEDHPIRAEYDEAGRVETRTTLVSWLPVRSELSPLARELLERAEAVRAELDAAPPSPPGETVLVPGLGTFVRQSSGGLVSWEAQVRLPSGEDANISLYESGRPLTPQEVQAAVQGVPALLVTEPELRGRVASEMLDDANHWWDSREDAGKDGPPLTAETFLAKLRVEGITVEDDGDLTVYYDDEGEVFAGHFIQVRLDADLNLIDMGLAG